MDLNDRLVRTKDVVRLTSLSKSTIRRKVMNGQMPRPLDLGGGMKAWRTSDLEKWMKSLPVCG